MSGSAHAAQRASSHSAGIAVAKESIQAGFPKSKTASQGGAEVNSQSGVARNLAKSLSAKRKRTLVSQSSSLTCNDVKGLTFCTDSPSSWEDINGDGCAEYAQNAYCTLDGDVGPGLAQDASSELFIGDDGLTAAEVCCACGAGKKVLRFGIMLGFSSSSGTLLPLDSGASALGAVLLAIREINADPAILSDYELLFAVQDSKCNRTVGKTLTKTLLQDWQANAIIGASCSSASTGIQEVADILSVPEISGSATSTSLSPYSYFLRTIPSDKYQAIVMADLVRHYNWTRVTTVAVEDEYGLGGFAAFHDAAEQRGITVAHRLTYPPDTADFSGVVADLQESRAYIIVVFASLFGQLMEQAYMAGVGGEGYVWIGSDTTSSLWEDMSSQLSDTQKNDIMRGYLGPVPYVNKSTPEYVAFAEQWAAQPATVDEGTGECSEELDDVGVPIWMRYDVDHNKTTYDSCIGFNYSDMTMETLFNAYYYDATYVMARAFHKLMLNSSTAVTTEALRGAMLKESFVGASGHVTFDENGDRAGTIQYVVLNHAGESQVQPVAFWSSELTYMECVAGHQECHSVVWSTGQDTPPTQTRSYRIGVALALSEDRNSGGRVAAIMMAIAHVARDPSLLPGTALLFALENSDCNADGGREAARQLYDKGADVVIGTSCSSASLGAQELLGIYEIPQISGSATSVKLSTDGNTEMDAYPYFMRTVPSDASQAIAMADLVVYYNWSHVATVAVEDDYGLAGIDAFHLAAHERGIQVLAAHRLTYPFGLQNFSEVVEGLQRSHAYIIVMFGHPQETAALMEQAYAAGVGGEGYVWIGSDATASSSTWNAMSSQLSDADKNDIMRGYLGMSPYVNKSTPEYAAFAEQWAAQPATVDEETGECSEEVDDAGVPIWMRYEMVNGTRYGEWCMGMSYATEEIEQVYVFHYDAMYVVARALHEVLELQEGNIIDRAELKEAMLQQSFAGASGQVEFDDVGDRATGVFYEVLNHAGDSQLRPIGIWDVVSKFTECSEVASDTADCHPVVWSTGLGAVPKTSHVYVGFIMGMVSDAGSPVGFGPSTASSLLALQAINEDPTMLPNTMLLMALEDGRCEEESGGSAAAALQKYGVDVVVGATCSSASMNAVYTLAQTNTPLISSSSTSPSLTQQTNFLRTTPSDALRGKAMADLVHYYNWARVATVAVDDEYGRNGIEEFHHAAEGLGIDIPAEHRLTYPAHGTEDFSEVVAGLQRSRAHIIVLYAYGYDTFRLMEQAYAGGAGGKGYVWIASETDALVDNIARMSSDLTDAEKTVILQGFFGFDFSVNTSTSEYMALEEQWAAQPATVDETGKCSDAVDDMGSPIWMRPFNDSTQCYCMGSESISIDAFSLLQYDAVYVVARALHELVEVQGQIEINGLELREAMLEQSFTGVTGLVAFNSEGDRTDGVVYDVVKIDEESRSSLHSVGTWNIADKYKECDQTREGCYPIDWSTEDGAVPKTSYMNIGAAGGLIGTVGDSIENLDYGEHVAGIALAIAVVNSDPLLLPSTTLRFLLQDSRCEAAAGRDAARRLLLADADVVVGTSCTTSSEPAQQELKNSSVPQISGAASSPSLSQYSYFMRTIPSDSYMAIAMADLVQYYNWTRVATVAVDSIYGRYGIEEFHDAALARSIDVVRALMFSSSSTDALSEVVAELQKSRLYIIVVFAFDVDIGRLIEQAYMAGVGGEGYVWIGSDSTPRMMEAMSSQLSDTQKNDIMRGYLGPVPYVNKSTPEYVAFAEQWAAQPATVDEETGECSEEVDDAGVPIWMRYDADNDSSTYDICVGFNQTNALADASAPNGLDRFAVYFYDAAMVVARALHHLLQQESTYDIVGAQLRDHILAQSFVGATGHISFDDAGDRVSGLQYEVLNHAGVSGLQRVAFHSSSQYMECSDDCHPVVWSSGADRPQDGTCEAGRVFIAEDNQCERCAAGSFHDLEANDCLPCEPGSVTLDAGATVCLACRDIKGGYYQDLAGQASCKDCPLGADCSSGVSAVGLEGYWRDAPERESFYECYSKDSCMGEVSPYQDPGCLEGHQGPLCSVCAGGYTRSQADAKQGCTRCEGGSAAAASFVTLIVFGLVVCMTVLLFLFWPWVQHYRNAILDRKRQAAPEAALRVAAEIEVQAEANSEAEAAPIRVSRRMTIMFSTRMEMMRAMIIRNLSLIYELFGMAISTAQQHIDSARSTLVDQGFPAYTLGTEIAASLVSFSQVLDSFIKMHIDWPESLREVFSQLNINEYISLDLAGLQCNLPSNFYQRYYLVVVGILSIIGLFSTLALASNLCIHDPRDQQVFQRITLKAVIFVLFFFYPFFCSRLLLAFPCRKLYETTYLMHDYSEECFTPEHVRLLLVAVVGFFGFVAGVPLFFYCCMLRFKIPAIVQEKRRSIRAANLLLYFASQELLDVPVQMLKGGFLNDRAVDALYTRFIDGSELTPEERLAVMKQCIDQAGHEADDDEHRRDKSSNGDEVVMQENCVYDGEHGLKVAYEPRLSPSLCKLHPEGDARQLELALLSKANDSKAMPSKHLVREQQLAELLEFAKGPGVANVQHFPLKWVMFRTLRSEELTERQVQERDAIVYIGFLFAAYKPQYWFFEILETFRKLIYVAIPVLWDQAHEQLLRSMFVCLLYVACLHFCQPDASGLNQTVKITCAYVLLLDNFYAWMMLAGMVDEEGGEQKLSFALAAINVVAFCGPALISVYVMLLSLRNFYVQHRLRRSPALRSATLGKESEYSSGMMAGD
ncbi:hypothetical protein CYMTET_22538 [Cymbomonas tetramitiformis]|uniref:Receptor ligand binding region domain-containing protein n=1 Tax=Cymbomonas tetramitiformis TaxID=36881 RepID=A0AAE0FZP6_9CHLO|nr:hypothetical protein CYMTET_22538 [Cymbomonas tetramitiformis]